MNPNTRLAVKDEIEKIIQENHDSAIGGHTGINRLYKKLKNFLRLGEYEKFD